MKYLRIIISNKQKQFKIWCILGGRYQTILWLNDCNISGKFMAYGKVYNEKIMGRKNKRR